MNRGKSPPVDLDKYLVGKEHRYCTYQDGARLYRMAYWSFVTFAKEAGANIQLRKTALVDLDLIDKYIEETCGEDEDNESEELFMAMGLGRYASKMAVSQIYRMMRKCLSTKGGIYQRVALQKCEATRFFCAANPIFCKNEKVGLTRTWIYLYTENVATT